MTATVQNCTLHEESLSPHGTLTFWGQRWLTSRACSCWDPLSSTEIDNLNVGTRAGHCPSCCQLWKQQQKPDLEPPQFPHLQIVKKVKTSCFHTGEANAPTTSRASQHKFDQTSFMKRLKELYKTVYATQISIFILIHLNFKIVCGDRKSTGLRVQVSWSAFWTLRFSSVQTRQQ